MRRIALATALIAATAAPAALAAQASPEPTEETAPAMVSGRGSFVRAVGVPLGEPGLGEGAGVAAVVVRPVAAPAATVDRALAEQPVRPYLIEVRLVNTTVYLDPAVDYGRKRVGSLDEDHFILKAQRVHASLQPQGPRVMYPPTPVEERAGETQPAFILHRPAPAPPRPQAVPGRPAPPRAAPMEKIALAE